MFYFPLVISLLTTGVLAHFTVPFPGDRNENNMKTQTISPCGGENSVVLPRYEWNPNGSPVEIAFHHEYGVGAIYFCGNGNCTTGDDFDTLVYQPVDMQKGNFCIPALQLPSKINNVNTTGVIQIIYASTGKESGKYEYMYNCIDILVSEDGPVWDNQCSNSTTVLYDESVYQEVKDGRELDNSIEFTYLDNAASMTSTSMDMDMGGMDMQTATTMSMSTPGGAADMNMSGMYMGNSSSTSMDITMKTNGASTMRTMTKTVSSTTSSVSTAGSNKNSPIFIFGVFSSFISCLF